MRAVLLPVPRLLGHPDEPPEAALQAGCFTRSQARRAGIADDRQRRLIGDRRWKVVTGSVIRGADLTPEPWMRAHAAALASGRHRAVSHTTAAALWGWPIDHALHVTRPGGRVHPGIVEHRLALGPGDVIQAHGVRVTTLLRTLTDLLTSMPHDQAVTALADGLRLGLFTPAEVQQAAVAASGRYGAPLARELAWTCRGGPYSFLEWEFHQVAWTVDADGWVFNTPLRDAWGLIGRVDALHVRTRTVVELDGRAYHDNSFQVDRTRDQRIAAIGGLCVRITHEDMRSPLAVAHRLTRIIAARS